MEVSSSTMPDGASITSPMIAALLAKGMFFHGSDQGIGVLTIQNSNENPFIRDIERVEPKESAGALDLRRYRQSILLDLDAQGLIPKQLLSAS